MFERQNGICLTMEELELVAKMLGKGVENAVSEERALYRRYTKHLLTGCVDCEETVDAIQIVDHAAAAATENVLRALRGSGSTLPRRAT